MNRAAADGTELLLNGENLGQSTEADYQGVTAGPEATTLTRNIQQIKGAQVVVQV